MKKGIAMSMIALLLISVMPGAMAESEKQIYYISEYGNDYNDGRIDNPYKTIERAMLSVRHLKNKNCYPNGGVDIILREGRYVLDSPLKLYSEDSGLSGASVTYSAYNNENVSITSGADIAQSSPSLDSRLPEQVRGIVREIDVSNLQLCDYTQTSVNDRTDVSEQFVVFDEQGLYHTAQYPNKDLGYLNCTANESEGTYNICYTEADSPRVNSWSNKENILVSGYPCIKWKYENGLINSIDTDKRIINVPKLGGDTFDDNPSIWVSNVLEELDAAGEYYFDRVTNKLFYYPKTNESVIGISKKTQAPLRLFNADNIVFKNIIFEGTAGNFVEASGCDNLKFTDCVFRSIGNKAVTLFECTNSEVENSEIYQTGGGGIKISGGDRYNLIPSANAVKGCNIYEFAQIKHVYSPAVDLNGVGNSVIGCDIHDEFHQGISLGGNDCILKRCRLYNLCVGTEDAGAVYSYSDSSCRGNILEENYFENIGSDKPTLSTKYSTYGVWAVYFDGNSSGHTVKNNVVKNSVGGIFANNGGNISITDNTFIDVSKPVTAYPVTGFNNYPSYFDSYKGRYYNRYYNKEAWSKYKNYEKIINGTWTLPSHVYTDIVVTGNKYYGELTLYTDQWVAVDQYPYKRQTVYVEDTANVMLDDAVIVFENNNKYEGIPQIDRSLYGIECN